MEIKINEIYRHFKGNLYKVVALAEHAGTGETLVIYQALYGEYKMYARELAEFLSDVDSEKYPHAAQKKRFEWMGSPMDGAQILPKANPEISKPELDPLLEAYLDAETYRERLNILHGIQHRVTEHMLNTMAVVVDFELPEGELQRKYDALHDCLIMREKYEGTRMR